ncbi:dihydroorotase [compost metagenome]
MQNREVLKKLLSFLKTQEPDNLHWMKRIITVLLVLVGFSAFAQKTKVDLIIKSGKIINVKTGKIETGKSIVINNGVIVDVVDSKKISKYQAKEVVNTNGKYVLPGLWDMHMHFGGGDTLITENKNLLPLFIAYGITTVRDAAADITPSVLQWRTAINNGKLLGPTIFTSGPKLEGYKSIWPGDLEITTSEELSKALDSLQKLKVDFVKITDNAIKPELYLEAIKAARDRGFKISGHVPYSLTMEEVVDAGLSSVEHLSYVWKAGTKNEKEISVKIAKGELKGRAISKEILKNFDEASALAIYKKMAEKGTAVTPTLNISYTVAYLDKNDHKSDDYLKYIGKGLQRTYDWRAKRAAQDNAEAIEFRHEVFEKTASILPLLQKAGVKILAGTDAGFLNSYDYPGLGLHQELELLVKYGLTPLEALQASVVNSPAFLNKDNYGAIAKGKIADVLLLDENPLENISNTQRIYAVITKGKLFNRKKLDQLLGEVQVLTSKTK